MRMTLRAGSRWGAIRQSETAEFADGALESDTGSKTDHQSVRDRPPDRRRKRRCNVTSGMEDQLQIRLQQQPWRNSCFVGNFEHALVIAYRASDTGEENLIPVQAAGIANPPIDSANPQHVELAVREEALEGEAGVDLESERIAVGR